MCIQRKHVRNVLIEMHNSYEPQKVANALATERSDP